MSGPQMSQHGVFAAIGGLGGHLLLPMDQPQRIWPAGGQNWQFQVRRTCPIFST